MAAKKTNPNDEFNLDDLEVPEVKTAPKRAAAPKPVEKFIDPEDDRENWPIIRIDSEDGKPNYETVIVAGTKKDGSPFDHTLQIRRGDEVPVPPSVVNALKTAVATHFSYGKDPVTGAQKQVRQDRGAVPWQLVKGGKYC